MTVLDCEQLSHPWQRYQGLFEEPLLPFVVWPLYSSLAEFYFGTPRLQP